MKIPIVMLTLACFLGGRGYCQIDPLEELKLSMARSACCSFEFLSTTESAVFETTDSVYGTALIATDGRYRIALGTDEYLQTSQYFYAFSADENQVTVEMVQPLAGGEESISFITRLDDFYKTTVVETGRRYALGRLDSTKGDLPEELTLFLLPAPSRLGRLEFLDHNEDLNVIVFQKTEFLSECDAQALEPDFPDSTEIVKLY